MSSVEASTGAEEFESVMRMIATKMRMPPMMATRRNLATPKRVVGADFWGTPEEI